MKALKCDRCGAFYDYYRGCEKFEETEQSNTLVFIDRGIDGGHMRHKYADLCPKCMEEMEKFFYADSATISASPETKLVSVEIGENSFNGYISSYEEHEIAAPRGMDSTIKRKLTIVEI